MINAALFIDNSNFYHALKESGKLPFHPKDYSLLFEKLSIWFDLKQIILYDASKDSGIEPEQYASQQRFHAKIKALSEKWPIELKTRKLKYRRIETRKIPIEKGIDILIAVDAIKAALSKKVDSIIILSGDADFVPAVEFIKSLGLKTVNVHLYSGSSTELRNKCDENITIEFDNVDMKLRRSTNKD